MIILAGISLLDLAVHLYVLTVFFPHSFEKYSRIATLQERTNGITLQQSIDQRLD